MTAKKKLLKVFIIFILAVFLLSTGLISVLYLGGKGNSTGTGDVLSGDILTGDIIAQTGINTSGSAELPKMTKEEASKKLQETLSGLNNKPAQ